MSKSVPKVTKKAGAMIAKCLTDNDMKALFYRFENPATESEYRNKALLWLMSSTGLRAKEIVNLKFSDKVITPDNLEGFLYIRKGGKQLVTIPSEQAIIAIKEYHRVSGFKSDHFVVSLPTNAKQGRGKIATRTLQRIIDSWHVQRADGQKATPHSFRHTVGQRAFLAAGSMAAQKILGHSSPVIASKFYTLPYYDGSEILRWD